MSVTYSKLAARVLKRLHTISPNLEMNKSDVEMMIKLVFEVIADAVGGGEDISIDGFGRFYPYVKKPRTVKSSLTNTEHRTKYRAVVKFNPYRKLKEKALEFFETILGRGEVEI